MSQAAFIYGTAWKKDQTTGLVIKALEAGFVAIDTAAQPKNYREDLVGVALRLFCDGNRGKRETIFTKFSPLECQDRENLPYEASDPLERQIKSSVESSLWNFRLRDGVSWQEDAYIDSMLLHTPMGDMRGTLIAWRIFESYVPLKIRHLGLSNVKLTALQTVFDEAVMKPMIVQNPFCSASGFDKQIRAFCQSRGLIYQSFWTLSANRAIVGAEFITRIAPKIGVCPEVVMYALVMNLGIVVLNGTKDESRMRSDLQEVILVEYWAEENAEDWARVVEAFTALLQIADP